MSTGGDGDGNKGSSKDKDPTVAKTAGLVVFSGIAMSILKALNPCNNNNNNNRSSQESTPPLQESKSPPLQQPIKNPTIDFDSCPTSSDPRTVEIVKGDTLWGLSKKYRVSIDAIKEANGLTGDTIYAGKKLVIP